MVCDEQGGFAVRLVQGLRLIPLKVAHHLLKARALVEAVRPERLHLLLRNFARRPFHTPALGPRVAQLGYLAVPASVSRLTSSGAPPAPACARRPAPPPVLGSASAAAAASCNWGTSCRTTGASAARCGALWTSCFYTSTLAPAVSRWCRSRWCLRRCLCWWCLRRRLKWRLWLALWLRFVLAPRGLLRRFGSGAACGAACTSCLLRLRRLVFGRLHLIICGQDITRTTKTTREAGRRCRPGRSGGSACASG